MVSAMLIVTVIIVAPVILLMSFFLMVYFAHPDDKNEAYFPKAVVVFGLFLAFASVLVLPFDVANTRDGGGGLRVDVLWQIIYMLIGAFLAILIPFAFWFYESDVDPDEDTACCEGQFATALKYTVVFFLIFVFVLVMMYAFMHEAKIPVTLMTQSSSAAAVIPLSTAFPTTWTAGCVAEQGCVESEFDLEVPVTFPVYVMGFLAFCGWVFFAVFAGVGLVALPIDLVNEFRTRPVPLTFAEYRERRKHLGKRAKSLVDAGQMLQRELDRPDQSRKQRRENDRTLKKFEAAYHFLKTDYEVLRISKEEKGGNPIWYFFKLLLGIVGGILSLTWIIHIAIFVLPKKPVHPFLNQFFIELESVGNGGFPLFGIVTFSMYAFWLIWAAVKGNFRFGAQFPFLFRLYPMELNNTMMNSFLFNTWLILLCSVPCVQFCVRAFPVYARLTSADMLFGTQVQYLPVFKEFWTNNVFVWSMLSVSALTLLVLIIWPHDKAAEIERRIKAVEQGDDD